MRRQRGIERKVSTRKRRAKFVLVMEGKNTEPDYFEEFSRRNTAICVDIEPVKNAGSPITLTEKAASIRKTQRSRSYIKNNGDNDRVWAVFDRDEHDYIAESFAICAKNDVGIAFSNPCFELWLILHYQDYDKDEHRHKTQDHCENVCPGYTKNRRKVPDLAALVDRIEEAEVRADRLQERRDIDEGRAPLTTVQTLTRALRGL